MDDLAAVDVVTAWDRADLESIHPTRRVSEGAYRESGQTQAAILANLIPAGAKVMDFGCGDGRVAVPLAELGYQVTAVDSSPRMLAALAEQAPDMSAFQSDGSDLGRLLGRRKMDAAYCLAVLIHHGYEHGAALVAALSKTVRKGGLLVLDWPTSEQPHERVDWIDVTTWHPERQQTIANDLGLTRLASSLPWSVWKI
ncbi:2-polyprenyl-3-methyl-5-hydroxy-6-metoxy-1,4-benzoquinol methylase [Streptomyces sp. B3I7]|uniref:class I SAM-dependent methyltransferase n=1 Tax=Streptomyces sp. B3I7 TaxID=3042269 RepID=UPI00278AD5E6|nr:class I SAM-dependent methyltransferase [Streptomyces sp. B3I7]MDQ0809829.1 2-polyprenyl-3-methyl-5-hydroxy-6-metoxy-1,4-benzoquinol methylase [Streptomyces sp. B3I7]